jgi:dTDP-4-amino-4,6-dideoxygalactose transaminase
MGTWQVPLADLALTERDIEAVVATYRSGWLTMGPRVEALEAAFAAYSGARHAIAVSSGTAALHLSCLAAGLGPGDEVVVPSLTFVASASAIAYTGATPVFADIAGGAEPWMSARACEAVLTADTRAVMAVDYGGHAGELVELARLCERRGLLLLEDAAHAAGSRLDGQHLGTFGLAGAFSLFSNKNLVAGEGGLVITDDDAVAARVRLLRSHAMTTTTWDRDRGHASAYDVVALGFNYRMDEPRAALATARLQRLDAENARRAELDDRYRALLADVGVTVALAGAPGLASAHHLFVVVLAQDVDRDAVRAALAAGGIQSSVHYPPLHRTTAYADRQARLPVTEAYAARAVTLPLFASMTDAQQDLVVDALSAAVGG